jgi:hypothetical protein
MRILNSTNGIDYNFKIKQYNKKLLVNLAVVIFSYSLTN